MQDIAIGTHHIILSTTEVVLLTIILVLGEVLLRGIALWRAGRNSHGVWFWALLIVNSAGILPIIYLLFFSKKQSKN